MRSNLLLVVLVLTPLGLWGGDNITPLNVKVGLWEVTVTHSMTGMPTAPNIPPDALAQMPPEQRARIEAMMKGTPTTDVRKECVTKEKIDMHSAFSANRGECTRTVVSSSSSKLEVKFHCDEKQGSSDGSVVIEAIASDSVKSKMHAVTNTNGKTIGMDFAITSKYLGPDCGDVK
jgi:hypothetical protein